MTGCVSITEVCKPLGAIQQYALDLGTFHVARLWQPRTIYEQGDRVRPTAARSSGFELEALNDGQSGGTEPGWLTGNTRDGGIIWQRHEISNGSLAREAVDVEWDTPDALQIDNFNVIGTKGRQILVVTIEDSDEPGAAGDQPLLVAWITWSDGQRLPYGLRVTLEAVPTAA